MMEKIARRMNGEDQGFTLIELMVVVLIIGILIAIALPTFLGARTRAQDRAAQSSVRNALSSAKVVFTDSDSFPAEGALVTALTTAEPSLTFYTTAQTASSAPNVINVYGASGTSVTLVAHSDSGTCFYLTDTEAAAGGVTYAHKAAASCKGNDAGTTAGW